MERSRAGADLSSESAGAGVAPARGGTVAGLSGGSKSSPQITQIVKKYV